MKNFVFISPNFPLTYWKFCRELKNNGMRVLGIGDCPYDNLMQELKDSMHEYYKVSSLENNDEVFKAVAFFTYKYGKIDWIESMNEYWLEQDARLRTDFNIITGIRADRISFIKEKSLMKKLYLEAGIRGCEIGSILADRDPVTRENRYSDLELLRLAIPRRVYTDNHMAVIAAAMKNVMARAKDITTGYRIVEEAPILRHFTVKLARVEE